jgi:hypothetical protein
MRMVIVAAALSLVAAAPAQADMKVLREWHGEPGGYLGWAVSELRDIDHDGVTDVITSEPYARGADGTTWVYSGRTGRTLWRFDGAPGDFQGAAIADAGDVDRDGVHDIISGATTAGPGHAYVYSGRTGKTLYSFAGETAGDRFGSAVSSAGDMNLDGYDDVAVGAAAAATVTIFSGRNGRVLRRLSGAGRFGSGVDWSPGLLTPELIVGASGATPASVFAPFASFRRLSLAPPPGAGGTFGQFFVAGVGRVDRDLFPDFYVGDYGASWAGVFSGRDGSLIWAWPSAPTDGRGPGREAGDIDHDGHVDLVVGDYTYGPTYDGRVNVFSGATGRVLRTWTSTVTGENLGFDAVGVGDTNRDGKLDLLLSAAEGDTVYLVSS